MSQDPPKRQDLTTVESNKTKNAIALGNTTQLDLSPLPEAVQHEMMKRHAEGMINVAKKAAELGVENQALGQRIDSIVDTVKTAGNAGTSATVTGAYNDKMGRTEIIMGNTETAAKGKLSRSQTGEKDMTLIYVVIAAVVIVIIVMAIVGIGR